MRDSSRRTIVMALAGAASALVVSTLWWRRRIEPDAASVVAAPVAGTGQEIDSSGAADSGLRIPGPSGLLAEYSLQHQALVLRATAADFAVFEGVATTLWHYAASDGGADLANPFLSVERGQEVRVQLHNDLAEDTTIHWHGLLIDQANDGSGLNPVAAGSHREYRFTVHNRAGLYLYHAHPHWRTGRQFHHGLASSLLVTDDEEHALRKRLNLRWLERDIPLLIADKQVAADNSLVYADGADDWIGNRVLINWTPEPTLDVVAGLYRFRMANLANARMFRPAFVHQGQPLPMYLIGTDGGLLAKPWPIDDAFLAPAQRLDVLVDFAGLAPGDEVMLRSLDYVAMDNEDESAFLPDPMGHHPGAAAMGEAMDLMQLRVVATAPGQRLHAPPIPPLLSSLPALPDISGWPIRAFVLQMDTSGRWLINDWNMHLNGHGPVFKVKRGTREAWTLRNSMSSMPHPIHLHGFQFRIVSRSISPPDIRGRAVAGNGLSAADLGLMDTVVVWPGESVAIALDFSQPFSGEQHYMLHCHNLEHEDMGMMVTFAVID